MGLTTVAQDSNFQKSNPSAEVASRNITVEYNKLLALDATQQALFQKKIREFELRREKIRNSRMNTMEKARQMFALRTEEQEEMRDILTAPQMDVYRKNYNSIQPVVVDRVDE